MNIIGIIPARLASSRLPRKPMADILGMPMIGHVYKRCKLSGTLAEVYVATCDMEIKEYVESIGGRAIMTHDKHERASDRTAEALQKIETQTGQKVDIVVMIQGDEPMVTPDMIDAAVAPMLDDEAILVTNLMSRMKTKDEHEDPAEVKVVVDQNNFAMYFSREPIPSRKKGVADVPMLKQVCIIPFQRDFLLKYNAMEQTPLEIIESVDMNRILENGLKIKMVMRSEETYSVDTQLDLDNVNRRMESDKFISLYR
ncbi:MAG: 3-deoxy-manno-octulosonate cytidylyltransferase [Sphingobacteriaceae bacterium]|nr:3-deoxy-manno-octulosonate cytidylyltransferase [Sphingobacteriaceae bacterium]